MVDPARLSFCKRIVRRDAAVLTAHRGGHLAANFAADNVAAGKDVRHVRSQEFVDPDLTFLAKFDAGFLDGDIVGVRALDSSRWNAARRVKWSLQTCCAVTLK